MTTPREPTEQKQSKNGGAKIVVAESGKPATAKSQSTDDAVKWWRAFKRFMDDCDELKQYNDDLREQRWGEVEYPKTAASLEGDAEWCQKLVARCRAGFERFDPDSNYEEDEEGDSKLKTAHIATRLGVMMGAYMNTLPQSPELFARALVEHLADIDDVSTVALETACREIVRTEKWPDIPKIVDVVEKHVDDWRKRRWALGVERLRLDLIPVLVQREEKKKKEEHEEAIRKAAFQVQEAASIKQRLAQKIEGVKTALPKFIEERNAELAKLIQDHADWEKRESERMLALRKLEQEAQAGETDG